MFQAKLVAARSSKVRTERRPFLTLTGLLMEFALTTSVNECQRD